MLLTLCDCADSFVSGPLRNGGGSRNRCVVILFTRSAKLSHGTLHRRVALLAGGDAAALLLFAAVGRGSHAELDGLAGVLDTAWPFIVGARARLDCR